jgi:hypothetical protein
VSLPDHLWEALELDRPAIAAQARFQRAYAQLEESPFDVRDIMEMLRYGRPPGASDRVVDLLGEDGQALAAQLREDYRPAAREPWIRSAEIADSLRTAAIANLLLHTPTGRADLVEAGHEYRTADLPFGDFLVVAAAGDRELSIRAADRLQALLSGQVDDGSDLLEPAQLRYLLLAAAPDAADLGPALAQAPYARQAVAVGAASQPFSIWWRIGDLICRLSPDDEQIRWDLGRSIARVAEAHGRQLESAMADRYHWSSGQSRVEVIDLDLAGAVAISARVMAVRRIRPWDLEEEFAGLSPAAQVSIVMGLQLGGEDPTSDDHPDGGPRGPAPNRRDERQVGYGFG